jgi:pimeloyl-ACP methyl ester carboxylesterase
VRQPEVTRLTSFVLAVLLVLPIAHPLWALLVTGAFLVELLSGGSIHALSALTPAPVPRGLRVRDARVDVYSAPALVAGTPLVLVHGYAPAGKDEPRVRQAAALLTRAGFDVAVPTIPGLTRGRLRPDDAAPVAAAIEAHQTPSVVIAVSVGAGPALLAAAEPGVRDRVRAVLCLGGYASAAELLRFYLTGDFGFGDTRGHVDHDAQTVGAFVDANADLVDAATRAAVAAGDRARVESFLDAPPGPLRALLDALSPERVAHSLRAPLILIHGRHDRAVPYTESLRLAAARPEDTRVVIIGLVDHVEGTAAAATWRAAREFLTLWSILYSLSQDR